MYKNKFFLLFFFLLVSVVYANYEKEQVLRKDSSHFSKTKLDSDILPKSHNNLQINADWKNSKTKATSVLYLDTCIARMDEGIYWSIDGWIIGNEVYSNYIDPAISCSTPYPYVVTDIQIPMLFDDSTSISVSVGLSTVNNTDINCPVPGTVISTSFSYNLQIPAAGLYNIIIPLNEPVEVYDPFFADFYIGEISNISSSPSPTTDSVSSTICQSYNKWDDSIGFIDLNDNLFYNFPGRLVLYVVGNTNIEVPCCVGIRGNVDGIPSPDLSGYGGINIADLVYLVSYLYGDASITCEEEMDIDGSGLITIEDIIYLVDFIFKGGPEPVSCP